jgi:hypothetical protein
MYGPNSISTVWLKADASSNGISLGKITNWNTNTVKIRDISRTKF